MTDLVEWLTAQLDADEAIARKATPGPWVARSAGYPHIVFQGDPDAFQTISTNLSGNDAADAAHIAANDPASVLRTIAAHRAILGRHERSITFGWCRVCWEQDPQAIAPEGHDMGRMDWPCPDVRSLAAIYQDRPGFDPSWKVET